VLLTAGILEMLVLKTLPGQKTAHDQRDFTAAFCDDTTTYIRVPVFGPFQLHTHWVMQSLTLKCNIEYKLYKR
jgi:hypothetical protein